MKILYPGCRARLKYVRKSQFQRLVGSEVLVLRKFNGEQVLGLNHEFDWVCQLDDYPFPGYFLTDQLEPVVPEGLLEEVKAETEELECA